MWPSTLWHLVTTVLVKSACVDVMPASPGVLADDCFPLGCQSFGNVSFMCLVVFHWVPSVML